MVCTVDFAGGSIDDAGQQAVRINLNAMIAIVVLVTGMVKFSGQRNVRDQRSAIKYIRELKTPANTKKRNPGPVGQGQHSPFEGVSCFIDFTQGKVVVVMIVTRMYVLA